MASGYKKITAKKSDGELDFNSLVVTQMQRCGEALSSPLSSKYYPKCVRAFSSTLAHLKQKCKIYKDDMTQITIKHRKDLEKLGNRKGMERAKAKILEETSIAEFEALVRLCARNNLFPSQRGELNDDD